MSNKTLYLLEMGCNDQNITTDIKNHRVRVLENIDIIYKGIPYNMFFEFLQGIHINYRTTNKRTGAPLKKAVKEIIKQDALFLDTQFERDEVDERTGYCWKSSWRKSDLEREIYEKHYDFSRKNVLKVINKYALEKYERVVLVEEESRRIASSVGGYREKEIVKNNPFFTVTDTWNEAHKVVRITERIKTETGRSPMGFVTYSYTTGSSCEVDLATGKICG